MEYNEEFEKWYSKIVTEHKDSIEASRLRAKSEWKKKFLHISMFVGFGILLYIFIYKNFKNNYSRIGDIILVGYVIFGLFYWIKKSLNNSNKSDIQEYKEEFKSKIISSLLLLFDENIRDCNNETNSIVDIYKEAQFEKCNEYRVENLVQAQLKEGYKFKMSEISALHENPKGETRLVFKGIFVNAEFLKSLGTTIYLREKIGPMDITGNLVSGTLEFNKYKIKLNLKEADDKFDIYSLDETIAMRILTQDIMQYIIQFQEEMKMKCEMTIKNNKVYIRIELAEIFDKIPVLKYSLEKQTLYEFYKIFDFSFTLTRKLGNLMQ